MNFFMLLIFSITIVLFVSTTTEAREAPPISGTDTILNIFDIGLDFAQIGGNKLLGYVRKGCRLNIHYDLIDPQPLILKLGSNEFYNPNIDGVLEIPYGQSIELHCNNKFDGKFAGELKIIPTCIGDKTFLVKGKRIEFEDFVCKSWCSTTARKTGQKCHDGFATLAEIGFPIADGSKKRFIPIAEVCHNEQLEATLYVHHFLYPSSSQHQRNIPRTNFREAGFYRGKNVDKLYKQINHQKVIGEILGGNHEQYFNEKKSWFLARGHLSAKADHIYGNQQRGTFYFINAAPQWQIFNAGNWQTIEDDIRTYVSKKGMYIECYTGTWGIATLPHTNGTQQNLYIHLDDKKRGLIPVPKLYYRVVIEPKTKRGIVFLGVNNPHVTMKDILNDDYIICDDIGDQIKWINWKKENISLGYSYACEVNQFARVVGHLPLLDVDDILW